MANEFIVRKGLIVEGASGGTVVDIQGSQGQLFSVTDDLSGSIFAVSDISGVPIFDVNSSGVSYFDGNVGIGTTSPVSTLHIKTSVDNSVAQGLVIERSANSDRGYINYNGGGFQFRSTVGDPIVFGETDAEHMRILPDGNVGIGTTNPSSILDIQNVPSGGDGTILNIGLDASNPVRAKIHTESYNGAFSLYDSGSNEDVKITTSGNSYFNGGDVGIGTTNPSYKLHVDGTVGITEYLYHSGDNNTYLRFSGDMVRLAAGGVEMIRLHEDATQDTLVINEGGADVDFRVESNTDTHALFVQGSDGNVGIGTASPDAELEISKAGSAVFMLTNTSAAQSWVQYVGSNDDFVLRDSTDGRTVFRVSGGGETYFESGNVGIGTTDPNYTLDVQKLTNENDDTIINIRSNWANTSADKKIGSIFFTARDVDVDSGATKTAGGIRVLAENEWTSSANSNAYMNFNTLSGGSFGERMRITSGGNVGIGTTDPDTLLNLEGAKNTSIITLGSTTNDANWSVGDKYGAINFYSGDQSGAGAGVKASISYELAVGSTGSTNAMVFRAAGTAAGTNNTERMRIDSDGAIKFNAYGAGFLQTDANGNITAGTVTTSDTLDDVTDNGNSTTNSITVGGVTSTGGGEMQGGDLYFKNGGDDGAGTHLSNVWYSVSTGGGTAPVGVYESAVITTVQNGTHGRSDIVFKTKNNNTDDFGSANERMRITKEGLVGINKTAPHAYLHIDGSSYPQLLLDGGSNTTGDIVVPDGEILQIGHWNNGTTTFTGRLWLASSGHLGIGNNSPESLLHLGEAVNGANIISFGDASLGGPHGLDFYGDDATRTKKFSIYYRTGTENISMEDGSGTKRWEISQSGAVTFNQAFTFPTADGSTGAALVTNGSGSLSWNAGYQQYTPVGWGVSNNQTYTSTGANISSNSTQAQAGTTPVQRNSATEFEATKAGWYEISYSFIVKNNYNNRAMIGAYMGVSTSGGGGTISGSHSTQYVRYNTYGEYAQIQNTFYYYTSYSSTNFYLYASLLSGSMNMTTQSVSQSMISFRYINNDIT